MTTSSPNLVRIAERAEASDELTARCNHIRRLAEEARDTLIAWRALADADIDASDEEYAAQRERRFRMYDAMAKAENVYRAASDRYWLNK